MPESAIIAGHGPGFCEALARKLAGAGFSVALFARSEDYITEFAEGLRDDGHEAIGVPADLTDPHEVAAGFDLVRERLGPIETVAHTASFHEDAESEFDLAFFEKSWRLYTYSPLLCFREAIDDLRDTNGTFLLFGAAPETGDVHYKSAKAGTRGLARALASEYGSERIQVTHVIVGGSILNPDKYERVENVVEEEHVDPERMAETCLYLVEQPPRGQTFELDVHSFGRPYTG